MEDGNSFARERGVHKQQLIVPFLHVECTCTKFHPDKLYTVLHHDIFYLPNVLVSQFSVITIMKFKLHVCVHIYVDQNEEGATSNNV